MRLFELNNTRPLMEGGNAIADSTDVPPQYIKQVVDDAKALLPEPLRKNLQADIGSAGFKEVPAGDIDLMIEASDLVDYMQTSGVKDPVKDAKKKLEAYLQERGFVSKVAGRNVHVGIPFPEGLAQVDYMIIHDAAIVAPWHQHGPRGSYKDPEFKGADIFIVMNSIAKSLGLKFDAFGAKLMRRENDEVVARTRDDVAKILLNPGATGGDLNSVKSILAALRTDPRRDDKLAQAREDAKKNIVKLPGDKE